MSLLVALNHVTHYDYAKPIALDMQTVRLRPAPHARTRIQSYSMNVRPKEHFINWQQDPFGNYLARIVFPKKTSEFHVQVDLVAEIRAFNPLDFFLEPTAESWPFAYESSLKEELIPYLEVREKGELLEKFTDGLAGRKQPTITFLSGLNQRLYEAVEYVIRLEPGVQSAEETLSLRRGSCRDTAWLFCQVLRNLGLAARFASGYLIQLSSDVQALDGPSGPSADFTDLHAWCEVYLPGAGWVGLDATSGLFAGEGHIPLCCTPSPSSAAPISGTLEACESTLHHEMQVTRIHEDRRVTKPYSASEWQRIDALGHQVDAQLAARQVRLTMGGEPTLVSRDDREGEAWHFVALSDDKERLGREMLRRLAARLAPEGLLQYSQGKWYPGEILPRWAMMCHWRADGEPLIESHRWLADPSSDQKHDLATAQKFLSALAVKLGIPDTYVLPAREDAVYHLWKEQRLPEEDEVLDGDLYEKTERKRLQTLMNRNLNEPVGYVLPLHYSPRRKRWISNRWQFGSGHLVLIPGNSPVGLRLPLGGLPISPNAHLEACPERSPFDQVQVLPTLDATQTRVAHRGPPDDREFGEDDNGLIRSAVCAEVRDGTLRLFLPPLAYVEHFLELIVSIESVAKTHGISLVLEGYLPPRDLRLRHFSVTPDPGVLEINVPPASSWEELKSITDAVYEEAHLARLVTDKFLLDGRRVGTGGGNHIVVGAASPADSPFLRRPDLLRSLVTFWQHHPSLSYLFSSQYIGPTSQAPRIDEARHDALYELEVAFSELDRQPDGKAPPWLVDRLFRNLLVDLTGNTHRAEFCIDKLFSPDGERGRLGLLELRGFEMTPHPQMNLVQALLMRACIAHFWEQPYRHDLIRWGTQLHDRFMLPHSLGEDFGEVLEFLSRGGFGFEPSWFDPFFAFRFPVYGTTQVGPVTLELRMALEPWPVLGEHLNAGGVSRAVDNSVERLQVKVTGATEGVVVVTCNGYALPIQPTREQGVQIAGVRYKAWAPPSSLHPTIPVHTPLVFDVIDTRVGRSLGGCTYHVMHPGGRSYETFPVNENEAEGRCLSRFLAMGHTPGASEVQIPRRNPDFPCTLDLRREA
jgi:uncharacterized protein (DUF2126 family)/transglutaminase-like putative cysteine protease